MSAGLTWVIGRGGLLGSHVAQALAGDWPETTEWRPAQRRIDWDTTPLAQEQLRAAVDEFATRVRQEAAPWNVLWCAGTGVVSASAGQLARESAALRTVLDALARALPRHPGVLVLASSAGGVFGGTRDQPLSEHSACQPLSDYGREKLRQEALVRDFCANQPRARALIARLSTLYGPGQNLAKAQGIISHLCRCLLLARPAHIYVPLDTLRDYLYAEDGARHLVRCAAWLAREQATGTPVTKILASETTTSISLVLGIVGRIAKQRPRIIVAPRPLGAQHAPILTYRSQILCEVQRPPSTSLEVGIQRVHSDLLARLRAGQLA